ncbi:MAG: NAD(P)-dependent dehydrogenase, short-chain alcohol dehydrogenase family [Hydrocarboniphaga sp.]|uniref:SDR family oxidoreductase n=1 Tax=Hydrocarboniphaga sp. TaxID=2033016 RepID=UPI00263686D8|nr:SDR family oxidoreductase [Hydrocarboniphaga sp.]MDB5972737.1 NAD(P)-dependent dehydrogenase, short-chain alcohol dehydrogenase family [Hydrocarboniphaga sp.]
MNNKKIALVTGGNRGIGYETSLQLAEQGVHVIIGARQLGRAADVAAQLQSQGLHAEALAIDVSDSASIAAAAKEIEARHGRLDILVNNAGILGETVAGASAQTMPQWRQIFDTNVFGLIETTTALLPLLRKSAAGRIVNVSSLLGSNTLHTQPGSPIYEMKVMPAYNVSKSAVNAWTVQLAYELKDTAIKVNAIHPGYVKTEMNQGGGEMEIPDGAKSSVAMALIGGDGPNGSFTHLGETLPW